MEESEQPEETDPELEELEKLLEDDSGPTHHYVLAHYVMRQFGLSQPLQMLGVLATPDASDLLQAMIDAANEDIPTDCPFDVDDLKIHTGRVGEFPCVIIEMPQPGEVAEAYMVALVLLLAPGEEPPEHTKPGMARYFTLEKGMATDGGDRTVLAEWSADKHANYGDGPDPTPKAFAGAIETMLK